MDPTLRCPNCQADSSGTSANADAKTKKSSASEIKVEAPARKERSAAFLDDEDDFSEPLEISKPFRPATGLAGAVKVLLFLNILFALLFIGSGYLQYELTQRILKREEIQQNVLKQNDSRHQMISLIYSASFLLTAIVFLFWFHRAYSNLESLGARDLKYSSGWAVGCWFVPILSLFRPVMIAQEIWRQSEPANVTNGNHGTSSSWLIGLWWTAWVLSNILGGISSFSILEARGIENLQIATFYQVVSMAASLVAAVFALLVVHMIDVRQSKRAAVISKNVPAV